MNIRVRQKLSKEKSAAIEGLLKEIRYQEDNIVDLKQDFIYRAGTGNKKSKKKKKKLSKTDYKFSEELIILIIIICFFFIVK